MTATINNQALAITEYNKQRVITLADVDRVHSRPEGTARKRFNDNKRHFLEGEDYYKLSASEIRTEKIIDVNAKFNGSIIFLTKFGYLLLVKSLTDDLAWKIQKELIKSYFEAHGNHEQLSTQYPHLDQSVYHLQQSMQNTIDCIWKQGIQLGEHEERITALEQSNLSHTDYTKLAQEYFELCHMGTNEFRKWAKESIIAIASKEGVHTNSVYRNLYKELDKECSLNMWRKALKTDANCLYYPNRVGKEYVRGSKVIYNIFDAVTKGHITWGHMTWRNAFAKLVLDRLVG